MPRLASSVVILVGATALAGWVFNMPLLTSACPDWVALKANAAFAFLLSGLCLKIVNRGTAPSLVGRLTAAIAGLIGLLTLSQYILGWDLGLDQLFFKESLGAKGTSHLGRMAPTEAGNFATIGVALLLVSLESKPIRILFLLAMVAISSLFNLVSQLYGMKAFPGPIAYTQMGIPSALTFLILSLGILFTAPLRGFLAFAQGKNLAALMTRNLIPAAFFIPLLLGYLTLLAQKASFYTTELGVSLMVLAMIIILTTLILSAATLLNRIDLERQQALQDIQKLNALVTHHAAQLQAANKDLEAFSYSVSHDLRAPLRVLNGFAQAVIEDYSPKLDSEGQHYLNLVRENAIKMGRLIDDLLAFSRLGRQEMRLSTIDMERLAKDVFEEVKRGETKERDIQVHIEPLPPARGDLSLIRQVLVNLLSNALKYSRQKNAAIIHVGFDHDHGSGAYYVKDNGAGFDMRYAHKLFGVFQRLHSNAEFEGTGVGLAIVNRIIQRHGGRIWAEAKEGEGAAFYFSVAPRE